MKTPEQVRDEAAEKLADECFPVDEGEAAKYAGLLNGFKSGYDYAVKNDPRVLALVDLGQGCGNSGCRVKTPAGMATNGPCSCIQRLKDALRAWEGEHDKG